MQNSQKHLTIVIFGATGDLYKSKLGVALFDLYVNGCLPPRFKIVGFGRKPLTNLKFRKFTQKFIGTSKKASKFLTHLEYAQGDLQRLSDFKNLGKCLEGGNRLFYLAVPPDMYEVIFKNIYKANLAVTSTRAWARLLIEKPFGENLQSAKKLNKILNKFFDEEQIYQVDHYLAKDTMRNLLRFRFRGAILEPFWNNKYIERVRIVFHEAETIGARANFFDKIGILRDIGQNHMLQMLALTAMEKSDSRAKLLKKVNLYEKKPIFRGQYGGYLREGKVKKGSKTETFFRVFLKINSKRWKGVSFEMEAGKAIRKSRVFIEVYFKNLNSYLHFPISQAHGAKQGAHEKVFYECILGERRYFVSKEEIMAEWRIISRIMEKWQKIPLLIYKKGSKGEDIQ